MILKVYNLTSRVNETKCFVEHESCECKRGLNESVYNSLKKQNQDECWCECKEIND